MAITTRDGLIAAMAASQRQRFLKIGTAPAAGTFQALWRNSGAPGAAAAGPAVGSGVALTNTAQGALSVPAPSNTSYLAAFDSTITAAGTLLLCDRIAQWGVDVTVTTAQAMSAVTLPARATSLKDIELWVEVETALGATQTGTINITYTDQDGNAGIVAGVGQFAASAPIGRTQPVALAAGDTGVVQVTSAQVAVATTGKLNVVLRRVICPLTTVAVADGKNLGYPETDLEVIGDNACLELVFLPQTTTTPVYIGGYSIAQG